MCYRHNLKKIKKCNHHNHHNHHHHNRHLKSRKRERGVVLVVALFLTALIATIAYAMMMRLQRDTERSSLIIRTKTAEFYAQGSIAWARDQLYNNWIKQKNDRLIDIIPAKSPVSEMHGFSIISTIYDMQARFNLNNLQNPEAQGDFIRLLRTVSPSLSDAKAKGIAQAITDWLSTSTQDNEYSRYYLALSPPYRVAHRFFVSPSELNLVKGMTPAIFKSIEPYITALPLTTPINVQTAEVPVLVSLSPRMTYAAAKAIEEIRKEKPFVSPQLFLSLDVMKNQQQEVASSKVTTSSQYFLVQTEVSIEKQHIVLYTLLERNVTDGKASVHPVWQSKNLW